jgi:hypothetical protein
MAWRPQRPLSSDLHAAALSLFRAPRSGHPYLFDRPLSGSLMFDLGYIHSPIVSPIRSKEASPYLMLTHRGRAADNGSREGQSIHY